MIDDRAATPAQAEDLSWLGDAWQRITSGRLYKIKVKAQNNRGGRGGREIEIGLDPSLKSDPSPAASSRFSNSQAVSDHISSPDPEKDVVLPFIPNRAQLRWLKKLWTRNIILKARQLGFTTLIAIIWLDHALFNDHQTCVMIAQDRETAEQIFNDKIKLAYDNLPEALKMAFPLARDSARELEFAHNGSKIRVQTSARSGTPDRLHISEFGKICARDPGKANEIITGSLPAVPMDGIVVIESTAEGKEGEFYKLVQRALAHVQAGVKLNKKQFRLQFFPWWMEDGYELSDPSMRISREDTEYFDELETQIGRPLSREKRCWWVAQRDEEFSGDDEKMWQEFPSTPEEAFKVSTEGVYYHKQLAALRKKKQIGNVPYVPGLPVNTFWDIGASDGTAVWLHQRVGAENRFIGFYEGWDEHYSFYTEQLQKLGYMWGIHYLPHDADHKRQQLDQVTSPKEELEKSGLGGRWETVPVVHDLQHGIQQTRQAFSTCWIDEVACEKGLAHLAGYRKTWSRKLSMWVNTPDKTGGHSEAADAMRQFAQAGVGTAGFNDSGLDADSLRKFKNRRRGSRV